MGNTITFKCDTCGQELTFYCNRADGYGCPNCYKSILKPLGKNIRGIEEVKMTRELYRKKSKKEYNSAL